MGQPIDRQDRCLAMIAILNQEYAWNLSPVEQQQYAAIVARCIPDECSEIKLRMIAGNYHLDHELVEALQDADHQQHDRQWHVWMTRVVGIIRQNGLGWSHDRAVDIDDLCQVAQVELVRSIRSFCYRSRFSTWAHQVVVQSIKRVFRDSQALKRRGQPESLEQSPDVDVPIDEIEHPDAQASANVLAQQARSILAEHSDRLALIFDLWAIQSTRIEDIGRIVDLHPSRVRALLKQARQILRQHPTIQTWHTDLEQTREDAQEVTDTDTSLIDGTSEK